MSFTQAVILIAGTALITIFFVRNQIGSPLHKRISELERRVKLMTDFLEANTSYKYRS